MKDEEFITLIQEFENNINQRYEELRDIIPDSLKLFPIHDLDTRYDKEKGGFIQIFMLRIAAF